MLLRKMWRDIKGNYGAYLAATSVLVIGLMMYVSLAITLDNMLARQDSYYREYAFADGFARIVQAPEGVVNEIISVPGVTAAVGRIVTDTLVYRPEGKEITTVRLISFRQGQPVNNFKLESGRLPRDGEKEILVTPKFFEANRLQLGSSIPLIIQGKEVTFTVTGTANSPEFTYEIPNGLTLFPNPRSFGVAYITGETLAPLVNMDGLINDLAFTLQAGVDFSQVEKKVTRIIEDYGLQQIYPRKDQLAHAVLTQEITGLKGSAVTMPILFLVVAASILFIMLRRMVEHQRGQIGILKAFGFTDWEILRHYLGYAALIGFVGGLLGGLTGSLLSYYYADIYRQYYNIPDFTGSFSLFYIFIGIAASVMFSLIAGFQGAKRVLSLVPAEAMRPPAPWVARKTLVEKIKYFWDVISVKGRMAVRNLFRNRQRTGLAVIGIAAAFSMMVTGRASMDGVDYLIYFQFDKVEQYNVKVSMEKPVTKDDAFHAVKNLTGVIKAEPFLEVPATISHRFKKKDIVINGVTRGSSLYQLLDKEERPVELPADGMAISEQLAKIIDVRPGDIVTIKPVLGAKQEYTISVNAVIPQYVGIGAYMEIDTLSQLLELSPIATSVLLKVDDDSLPEVRKEIQAGKNVAAIHDKSTLRSQFEEIMASTQATQFILFFFAFLTGFAIVYNVTLIAFSERERELSTLLVLGMTAGEVGRIMFWEQVILGFLGVLAGIPLSYGMLYAITQSATNELFTFPLVVSGQSYLIGIIGTALFLVVSQWRIGGKIHRLSLVEVLKQQD